MEFSGLLCDGWRIGKKGCRVKKTFQCLFHLKVSLLKKLTVELSDKG
jgi:hypothetical protein